MPACVYPPGIHPSKCSAWTRDPDYGRFLHPFNLDNFTMTDISINYVSMLMFSRDCSKVVLLTKDKPAFLAGLLCPVGGKVEPGEAALAAVLREFFEEAGVQTCETEWIQYALCRGADWLMHCYVAFSDAAFDCRTMTSEVVSIHDVSALLSAAATTPGLASHDLIAFVGLAMQQRQRRVVANLQYA